MVSMQDVLGLDQSEMAENLDLDLFESGLVDSLAMVTLITDVERNIGSRIAIREMNPESFLTVSRLTEAIDRQLER